jgi:4-carboxymuconolactone decarboxylase
MNIKSKTRTKSKLMDELYGERYSQEVYERLESLDPELNDLIQEIPYDKIWSRPGLNMRDKSLITVVALIAMGKEEQSRIHMRGFLNSGGNKTELKNTILHLAMYCGFPTAMNGFQALNDVLADMDVGNA